MVRLGQFNLGQAKLDFASRVLVQTMLGQCLQRDRLVIPECKQNMMSLRWHARAVSFPLSDVILAQLACPLSDMFCLHSGITNLSLYKQWAGIFSALLSITQLGQAIFVQVQVKLCQISLDLIKLGLYEVDKLRLGLAGLFWVRLAQTRPLLTNLGQVSFDQAWLLLAQLHYIRDRYHNAIACGTKILIGQVIG